MKEKSNQQPQCLSCACYSSTQLPPCLPEPEKLSTRPLFEEEWNRVSTEIHDRMREKCNTTKCTPMENHAFDWRVLHFEKWRDLNPCPSTSMCEFVNLLATRVEALEKKGGVL